MRYPALLADFAGEMKKENATSHAAFGPIPGALTALLFPGGTVVAYHPIHEQMQERGQP